MFRAVPGHLPAADTRDLAGIALPPGRIVTAAQGAGAPVAWVSSAALPEDRLIELVRALAEHYAFCPDNIDQGMSPDAFRLGLAEWPYWNFWWD
ncbi:DUF4253 domain-containing protein [Mycobacterium sp. PDNC021]|uniref:DUF4253 domain-containing protein n=1 Tax=Mycobacterium sp. PDNC021 TaxID=3391399 RepID=UPI003AABE5BC